MEAIAILLSVLVGLVSPVGTVSDRLIDRQIRKQFSQVEQLQVRVDNAPTYQLLQGKIDKVRIAGRGLYPVKELRIDTLDLETDPIALKGLHSKLAKPLQAAAHLVITERDLNTALRSPAVTSRIKNLGIRFLEPDEAEQVARYDLINPQIDFLPQGRIRLQAELLEQGYPDKLAIVAETGLSVTSGRTLQLVQPTVLLNGRSVPQRLVDAFAKGLSQRLDLQQLEAHQMTARILRLSTDADKLDITAFIQVRPKGK